MNKFLTATSVLLLALSGYLGYQVYELSHAKKTPLKVVLDKSCSSFGYDYSNSSFEGIINYETAETLAKNYNNSKKGIIAYNDKPGAMEPGEDSRSIWFSLDRLKNFIWHIENINCGKGCADSLGLRIYFGRYPNLVERTDGLEEGLDKVPKKYSNRLTLFMVPTYKDNITNFYYDFYPEGKDCRIPLLSSARRSSGGDTNIIVHKRSPFIMLFDVSDPDPGSQNHGGLIPPGNPTGTSFN